MAALGGRLISKQATCTECNNSFSNAKCGEPEVKFAESLVVIRNALKIHTGRDKPPPTIKNAGIMADGQPYDLAPGFVPVLPKAKIPSKESVKSGDSIGLVLHDISDANRVLDIFSKRGYSSNITHAARVQHQAPLTGFTINIPFSDAHRVMAKTAIVGTSLLYGNVIARQNFNSRLLDAVKRGKRETDSFSRIDFSNDWPSIIEVKPHPRTLNSTWSGFEHSIIVTDVGRNWIAYLTLFGHLRFSVRLGKRSGLPPRGLAINPRVNTLSRFELTTKAPCDYQNPSLKRYRKEYERTRAGVVTALENILASWHKESINEYSEVVVEELFNQLSLANGDETKILEITRKWAEKLALVQSGGKWSDEIDLSELSFQPGLK